METVSVDETYKKEIRKKTMKPLLWVAMVSIVMFFGGLTSAVIVSKPSGEWISFAVPTPFYISTIVILLSSLTYFFAIKYAKLNEFKKSYIFVWSTLVLGIVFTIFQYLGWKALYQQGIVFAGSESNRAGSYFYALTFLHLLHLIGGLISLLVVIIKLKRNKYTADDYLGMQVSATYWHFLDVLWVYLFVFLSYIA